MQHSSLRPLTLSVAVRRRADRFGIDPFYSDFVAGMEDSLRPYEGSALLRTVDSTEEEIEDYRRWAVDKRIDGVVMVDFVEHDPRIGVIEEIGLPALLLGGDADLEFPRIGVDNARAMNDAIAYLAGLGHRRIGRVSGPSDLLHTRTRTRAFESALAAHGAEGRTVEGDYTAGSGATGTRTLLDAAERPTAIVYDNGQSAVAGVEAARELGFTIPQDLSLLAWDDSAECQLSDPPLSVMDRDVRSLGAAAASALLDVIEGRTVTVVRAREALVVERGTTAPPAA
ncbi:LacI family DNA-binding transcriptional regulator [Leifsonia sp. NPDC058292]|uniref:LacI family DNA-binding transcriptional regulator n=1 Tax=Leifsonia sp. NPDC058292 TaxID=3346428 RepID=UPI0036DD8FD5